MGGVTAFIVSWGFVNNIFLGFVSLFGGLGVGTGLFFTNLILRSDKFLEKAKNEAKNEEKGKREDALDKLDKDLVHDRDPGTNAALRDLRALAKAFVTEFDWKNKSSSAAAQNLLVIVNRNFGQCVETLRATLRLYNTINKGDLSPSVRSSLSKKRKEMIKRVQETIKNLTYVFEQMQELSTSEDPSVELSKHASDLTRELDLMKKIDERTRALDNKINLGDFDSSTVDESWLDEF